ncbi:LPS export ABC transporter permease LptG [Leeia aquatica]|uniref:LPS export ABC transporter permease LptG n=1 Tax=Leeia aquatica TaxID=2725557 RepID=A0A847S5W2_9NEIS|nr:LPS export ABC transporter permease LptG [Leeia aquatica]NLR75254.1 LPS export ABC transporter permease LptG [Leeia aquatica]
MRLLHRYFRRNISRATLTACLALLGLFAVIDLLLELSNGGSNPNQLREALQYAALRIPANLYQLLPICVMLGGLFSLAQLVNDSEYPVIRTAGVSLARVALSLLRIGFLFALLTLLVSEVLMPLADREARSLRLKIASTATVNNLQSGYWMRDHERFVNFDEVDANQTVKQLSLYELDAQQNIKSISTAREARYVEGKGWVLQDVTRVQTQPGQVVTEHLPQMIWSTRLTPQLVTMLAVTPEKMSAWQLYQYTRHLLENRQDAARYELAFWARLGYPLSCLSLLLLALPFAQFQKRSGGAGLRLLSGLLLGLLFYVLSRLVSHMALIYDWPPIGAALTPSLVILLLASFILWWQEYGRVRFRS